MIWQIGITPSAVRQIVTTEEDLMFYQFLLLLRRPDIQLLDLQGSLNRCVTNLLQEKTLTAAQRQKVQAVVEALQAVSRCEAGDTAPGCEEEHAWCKIWAGLSCWVDHVLCSRRLGTCTQPMSEIGQLLAGSEVSAFHRSRAVPRTGRGQELPFRRIVQSAEWLIVVIPHAGHPYGDGSEVYSATQLIEIGRELVQSGRSRLKRIDFLLYPGGRGQDDRDRAFADAQVRINDANRPPRPDVELKIHRLCGREIERRIYLGQFHERGQQRLRQVTAGVAMTHYACNNRPPRSSSIDSCWSLIERSAARDQLLCLNDAERLGLNL